MSDQEKQAAYAKRVDEVVVEFFKEAEEAAEATKVQIDIALLSLLAKKVASLVVLREQDKKIPTLEDLTRTVLNNVMHKK